MCSMTPTSISPFEGGLWADSAPPASAALAPGRIIIQKGIYGEFVER